MSYADFLKGKVVIAEKFGIDTTDITYNEKLFPHQRDIVNFCLNGGRRAIFASFGLGKTFMQLELAAKVIAHTGKPFLICCPLGVSGEFKRDNLKLGTGHTVTYITDTDQIPVDLEPQIYLTNYERVRKGDIKAESFGGVSFDEASILRNLKTNTTNMVLKYFRRVPFRFVATATPTPNDYIEILNYADYLGVISRGHALTRFFQRDSTKAGNIKLYPNKEKEFWQWVSTWAAFINTPADLGYDSTGYDLPPLKVVEHRLTYTTNQPVMDKWGQPLLLKPKAKGLKESSRETRETIEMRCSKALEVAENNCAGDRAIFWCLRNPEQDYIAKELKAKGYKVASVSGSLKNEEKERLLIGFSEGEFDYLVTKPVIAGSGCNFQDAAHTSIFVSIDDKFNDFIQAMHRTYRFGQSHRVTAHVVYTEYQDRTYANLMRKWSQHENLQSNMVDLVREYGLNADIIKSQMERQIFAGGAKRTIGNATVYNNDTVIVHQDKKEMPDNSIDLYLTSIPFGDHYEYSDNYNDFGHNHGNGKFFEQMDFLIPEMLRCLKPGRIAAIHVKDRIRYSYQNGTSFTTISDFSGQTVSAFEKHGFYLIGKITVTTDVVAENNQTYRLGWTEQCKDASKMGVGLPEYVLLFRKAPTNADNSYADEPICKDKTYYTKALWQLDAHAYHRSNGDRFLTTDEIRSMDVRRIVRAWKKHNEQSIYDFSEHLATCEAMDEQEKLSSTFMTLPVHSNNEMVWTDINRMNTLNAKQVNKKKEKHICPLQFDIIERLIHRYSNPGETVCDPFGGLFSTNYKAMQMGRKSIAIELKSEYFNDGLFYLNAMDYKMNVPTLFDMLETEAA
jgi:DNA modification methylase/superfamily II DNA or RNA helicase